MASLRVAVQTTPALSAEESSRQSVVLNFLPFSINIAYVNVTPRIITNTYYELLFTGTPKVSIELLLRFDRGVDRCVQGSERRAV